MTTIFQCKSETKIGKCTSCKEFINILSDKSNLKKGCSFDHHTGKYSKYVIALNNNEVNLINNNRFCFIGESKDVVLSYFDSFEIEERDFAYNLDSNWLFIPVYAHACNTNYTKFKNEDSEIVTKNICCRDYLAEFRLSFHKIDGKFIYGGNDLDTMNLKKCLEEF